MAPRLSSPHSAAHTALWASCGLAVALTLTGCGSSSLPAAANTAHPARAATAGAADAKETSVAAVPPQSTFRADPQSGRDPFYPNASRGVAKVPEAAPVARAPLDGYLKLVGIRSGTSRPMALINRTPFVQGEEGDVTVVVPNELSQLEVQKVNIRCLEIRHDSVLIKVAGESGVKELRMAQAK